MWALESATPASCKIPATFIDSIRPNNQPIKNKESRNEIQLPRSVYTGLKEVDLEPSPKTGSDKINMQKQRRNTQKKASRIEHPGLKYGSQHLERKTWNPVLKEESIGRQPY